MTDPIISADYLAGYESGYTRCTIDTIDRESALWWANRSEGGRIARVIAQHSSYAELCEIRGEHERAAAQRATLVRNGVVAVAA